MKNRGRFTRKLTKYFAKEASWHLGMSKTEKDVIKSEYHRSSARNAKNRYEESLRIRYEDRSLP